MLWNRVAVCQIAAMLGGVALTACSDADSDEKAKALVLEDVAAYWAVRGQDQEGNNYIHPVIRFRVVNASETEVGYVQAMAVFKREKFPDESWGNAFNYSISEEALDPGESSDLITMRSDANFVGKDAPELMFANEKWEEIIAEVFVRVGPSSWVNATRLEVPKRIGAPGLDRFLEAEEESEEVPPADVAGNPAPQ